MKLTRSPFMFFDPNEYTDFLLTHCATIRDEYFGLARRFGLWDKGVWLDNKWQMKINTNSVFKGKKLYDGTIKPFSLLIRDTITDDDEKRGMNPPWKSGEKLRIWHDRLEIMPTMAQFIYKYVDILSGVTFNTAMPGSIIRHHFGLDPKTIRIHLCIEESNGCIFNIEGWEQVWKYGHIFGFDDPHVFHGTRHLGNQVRSVLMIDIDREVIRPHCMNWSERTERPKDPDFIQYLKKLCRFEIPKY